MKSKPDQPNGANDVIFEAEGFRDFINAEIVANPLSTPQVLGLIRRREIPSGRLGRKLVGSKAAIRDAFARITSGR